MKKLVQNSISVLLTICIIFSAMCFSAGAIEQSNSKGTVSFNVNFYNNNKSACEKVANGIKNLEDTINIEEFNLSREDATTLIRVTLVMHPEFFYVNNSQYVVGSSSKCAVIVNPIYYKSTDNNLTDLAREEIKVEITEFNNKCNDIINQIPSDINDFEKALFIHDYLVLNCQYNTDYSSTTSSSAYDALIKNYATCQGYSGAYGYLLSLVGINSEAVSSEEMVHMWNKVCIDNNYYNVDVTWDDPINDKFGHIGHKYFMLSDKELQSENNGKTKHFSYSSDFDSNSTIYDTLTLQNIDTKVCFYNGNSYAICNEANNKYEKSLVKIDSKNNVVNTIKTFDYKWYTQSGTSYWIGGFMSLDIYGSNLYINSNDSINIYNLTTNTLDQYINNSDKIDGSYYGMKISDKDILVSIGYNPNSGLTIEKVGNVLEQVSVSDKIWGDVNGDKRISIADATLLQKYLIHKATLNEDALSVSDVTHDGKLSISDCTKIQKFIVNKFSSLDN